MKLEVYLSRLWSFCQAVELDDPIVGGKDVSEDLDLSWNLLTFRAFRNFAGPKLATSFLLNEQAGPFSTPSKIFQ